MNCFCCCCCAAQECHFEKERDNRRKERKEKNTPVSAVKEKKEEKDLFLLAVHLFAMTMVIITVPGSEQAADSDRKDLCHHQPERCHQKHSQAGCQLPERDHPAGKRGIFCVGYSRCFIEHIPVGCLILSFCLCYI